MRGGGGGAGEGGGREDEGREAKRGCQKGGLELRDVHSLRADRGVFGSRSLVEVPFHKASSSAVKPFNPEPHFQVPPTQSA